jgi:hypothetical protein
MAIASRIYSAASGQGRRIKVTRSEEPQGFAARMLAIGLLVALLMIGVFAALRATDGLARTGSSHAVAAVALGGSATIMSAGPPWT